MNGQKRWMRRILLDTSVYGRLVEEPEIVEVLLNKLSKEIVVYGTAIDAYKIINSLYGLRNPRFLSYTIFRIKLKNQEDFPV